MKKLIAFVLLVLLAVFMVPVELLADAADGIATSVPVMDKIETGITGVNSTILSGIAVVLELVFRLIPTSKPLSILHLIGWIIGSAGRILVGAGNLSDKVLPQKTKKE